MYEMSDEEFEAAVEDALDSMPDSLLDDLENVVFVVADEISPEQLDAVEDWNSERRGGEVLGLYQGVSLTRRDGSYGLGEVPDVISIFKGPHERCFGGGQADEAAGRLRREIRRTVIHEVGHYFGHDDDALRAMGY